ncbi:MAG: AMP-binding protein [Candidatus Hydrogenedentota bacterium]
MFKAICKFLVKLLFRFKSYNEAVVNTNGPVLLLPNHVSWLDWMFIGVCLEDDWKFVTSREVSQRGWLYKKIMDTPRTFTIDPASSFAVKEIARYLQKGGRLVLFPEGRITKTASLMKIYEGTGFLIYKTNPNVIIAYIRGGNRTKFASHSGWKQFFPKVTVHFSNILKPPELHNTSTVQARKILSNWLHDKMVEHQFNVEMKFGPKTIPCAISEISKLKASRTILEDVNRKTLKYRDLIIGCDLLSDRLSKILHNSEKNIGVLMPNVNATVALLLSLWDIDKVPAILNYTSGPAIMLICSQLAQLKTIITSSEFVERAKINLGDFKKVGIKIIFLEDIKKSISIIKKVLKVFKYFTSGISLKDRSRSIETDIAVILFTSGSENIPKGVVLTHRNIISNLKQMLSVIDIQDSDRAFNALPLFHSFGLTIGMLLPLFRGIFTFIYPTPLHYRAIPTVIYDRNCTIVLATNTFLNGYARKAHSYDFRSVRYLFAGAEKLQEETKDLWSRKYGIRILEGYGATECSPCVSVNTPLTPKHNSAGRLLPSIEYKIEPVEGITDGGRLFVRGPNIMYGYLNPDENKKFKALNGWYDTGDIASIDSEGFVHILGRLKRFAKVSGEMVSLTAVEEILSSSFPHYGLHFNIAIMSKQDEDKGEVLIAVTNEPRLKLEELRAAIKERGLSNLYIPREIKLVKEIPKLGSGKTNYRELENLLKTCQ